MDWQTKPTLMLLGGTAHVYRSIMSLNRHSNLPTGFSSTTTHILIVMWLVVSLVPRFTPVFQCCTLKNRRAWCAKSCAQYFRWKGDYLALVRWLERHTLRSIAHRREWKETHDQQSRWWAHYQTGWCYQRLSLMEQHYWLDPPKPPEG